MLERVHAGAPAWMGMLTGLSTGRRRLAAACGCLTATRSRRWRRCLCKTCWLRCPATCTRPLCAHMTEVLQVADCRLSGGVELHLPIAL